MKWQSASNRPLSTLQYIQPKRISIRNREYIRQLLSGLLPCISEFFALYFWLVDRIWSSGFRLALTCGLLTKIFIFRFHRGVFFLSKMPNFHPMCKRVLMWKHIMLASILKSPLIFRLSWPHIVLNGIFLSVYVLHITNAKFDCSIVFSVRCAQNVRCNAHTATLINPPHLELNDLALGELKQFTSLPGQQLDIRVNVTRLFCMVLFCAMR